MQNELNNGKSVDAYSEHTLSNFGQSTDFRVSFSLSEKKILYSDFKKVRRLSCNIYFVMWQLLLSLLYF